MEKLHLLYQTKYTASVQTNKKILLTGDKSFFGNVILKDDGKKTNKQISIKLTLKCHPKLINYHQNQFIFINCLMFKKYPKFDTKFIGRDRIELPKREDNISWIKKHIILKEPLLPNIHFRIRVAVKPGPKENIKFIPTFKEIAKEISKLSDEEIQQERHDFEDYLTNGCAYLIYETLQQRTAENLMKQKKRKFKIINLSSSKFQKNQIKQKLIHYHQNKTNIKKL